jgi:hypothetical protein
MIELIKILERQGPIKCVELSEKKGKLKVTVPILLYE